eukprot:563831-Rhodomonas_salina.1
MMLMLPHDVCGAWLAASTHDPHTHCQIHERAQLSFLRLLSFSMLPIKTPLQCSTASSWQSGTGVQPAQKRGWGVGSGGRALDPFWQ